MLISFITGKRIILAACIGMALILFTACGEIEEKPSSESGSAAFSVRWANEQDSAYSEPDSMERAATINCSDLGITQVLCVILNSSGIIVKTGGPWDCSLGTATISNIPVGVNYRFVILARNSSNIYVQRGESNIVDISASTVTNVGTVDLQFFKPELQNPLDNSTVDGISPSLEWMARENINTYQLQVSTNSNFTDLRENIEISSTSFDLQSLQNNSVYYWRVRSIDDQNHESAWSAVYSFTTKLITENAAFIQSPLDGSSFTEGELITFSGIAEAVPGSTAESLEWNSNIDFELGSGLSNESSIVRGNLTPGEHEITLTATITDTMDNVSYHSTSISIHVVEDEWLKLIGGSGEEEGVKISIDPDDNIYVIGRTDASLGDNENRGDNDVYIAKYDRNGITIWEKLAGSINFDRGLGIAVGSTGNVYATGYTNGSMGGLDDHAGMEDVFIAKYTPNGLNPWIRMIGSTGTEKGKSVAVDSNGFIYVTGYSNGDITDESNSGGDDIFIAKFEPENGDLLWIRQLGTPEDEWGQGISIYADRVFITGFTEGDLKDDGTTFGGRDIFIAEISSAGELQWMNVIGTGLFDTGEDIVISSKGHVYVGGYTEGSLGDKTNTGGNDIFISKYDANDGTHIWTELIGSTENDRLDGIAIDQNENIFIAGNTRGDLDGNSNAGLTDIVISKVDAAGDYQWTKVEATTEHEWGVGIIVSTSDDYAYITGSRDVQINGENNADEYDIFIWKVDLLTPP